MIHPISVLMLGASGAVGNNVAKQLVIMPQVQRLTLINRRTVEGLEGSRLTQHNVDVLNPQDYANLLSGHDCAICCLGVGQPSKTSKEEFIRVDKTAVLDFASACKEAGVKHFELLGSVGAESSSPSFYLRTKGELQDAISALGFERISFFQPSMILTPNNRYGLTQAFMLTVWPKISTLLYGRLRKYRGIPVESLGIAMAKNIIMPGQGIEILQWDQIVAFLD